MSSLGDFEGTAMEQLEAEEEERDQSDAEITPVDAEERQHSRTMGHDNPVSVSWIRAEQLRGIRNFQLNSRKERWKAEDEEGKILKVLKARKSRKRARRASEDEALTSSDLMESRLRPLTWLSRLSSPLSGLFRSNCEGGSSADLVAEDLAPVAGAKSKRKRKSAAPRRLEKPVVWRVAQAPPAVAREQRMGSDRGDRGRKKNANRNPKRLKSLAAANAARQANLHTTKTEFGSHHRARKGRFASSPATRKKRTRAKTR